jgi:hypothetical protein
MAARVRALAALAIAGALAQTPTPAELPNSFHLVGYTDSNCELA